MFNKQTINVAVKPELATPFPNIPEKWKDPITGIYVPKFVGPNLEWRGKLLKKARNDPILQRDLIAASKESMLFWINTFAFTYHQHDINEDGHTSTCLRPHWPFITWDVQDDTFLEIKNAVETGYDLGIRKSRQMGASWMCITAFHWFWLFVNESKLLEMSRVREYVDQPGNMKSLFQKHDYINRFLPEWMRPPTCMPGEKGRTRMHMHNSCNNSTIDGESTTQHAGSGDTRKAILLDEFSKVENASAMRSATADVAPCRIVNSTPAGAGTEYSRWMRSGKIKVIVLPFWEHPEKGRGRYINEVKKGKYEIRSPWYDREDERRTSKQMAQEVLMQDIQSGDVFFDIDLLDNHKALFGKKPQHSFNIGIKKTIFDEQIAAHIKSRDQEAYYLKREKVNPLRIWVKLFNKRPDQTKSYVFGIDLSKGQGASNSVISIRCRETNDKIAEWADANVPPYEIARTVVALALWCGGKPPRKLPFIKWEMNGPGWDFGRMIVQRYHYPYYFRQTSEGTVRDKQTKKYGWHSGRESKKLLLDQYHRLLATGKFINHSIEALDEAIFYIYFPDGSIGPASLTEENKGAKKTHGDRVIADALCAEDCIVKPSEKTLIYSADSVGQRKINYLAKKKRAKSQQTSWKRPFNFIGMN